MLDAPRVLVAWALALLDAPPKALVFREASLLGICRLPILFPPLLRFAPVLPGLMPAFDPGRFADVAPLLFGRALAFEPARFAAELPRLPVFAPAFEAGRFAMVVPRLFELVCWRAFACRVDAESPRAVPP
jgi:hypothetical protein